MIQRLQLLWMCAKYCAKNRLPFISTTLKIRKLAIETKHKVTFFLTINYVTNEKKDTFYLNKDYFAKAFKVNPEQGQDLIDNKMYLFERCGEYMKRKAICIDGKSDREIITFIKENKKIAAKRNYGAFGDKFSVYDIKEDTPEGILNSIKEKGQKILEGYIYQHEETEKIYPDSVNTLRIHTVNDGNEVRVFFKPKFRMGSDGSKSDIIKGTGTYRTVVNTDGSLDMPVYTDKYGYTRKVCEHHNSGVKFSDIRLPFVRESIEMVKDAASRFPEIPYIGWDVALTKEGPAIVEGNSISGAFVNYQMMNYLYHGQGLKKEMDEMLDFGLKGKEV